MSRFLLDTCTFLWLNTDREKLPRSIHRLCTDEANRLYLSSVTVWEIAAKHLAGRLPLPVAPAEFITNCRAANAVLSISLKEEDISHLERLPGIHRDPFDRMLICQAISRGLTIMTPDPHIKQYPIPTIW